MNLEKAIPIKLRDEVSLLAALRKPLFELSFSFLVWAIVVYGPDAFHMYPIKNGFFCNDYSIMLPRLPEIVSGTNLYVYCFSVVIAAVVVVELYCLLCVDADGELAFGEHGKSKMWRFVLRALTVFAYFMIAFLITFTATSVSKWSVGRLRPRYIDVCKPNVDLKLCYKEPVYIAEYECTNDDVDAVLDARKSFFSGHSSYSMAAATFVVFYLYCRLHKAMYLQGALSVIQFSVFASGLCIGWSRFVDHSHHWGDVLVGQSVGVVVAALVVTKLARRFEVRRQF